MLIRAVDSTKTTLEAGQEGVRLPKLQQHKGKERIRIAHRAANLLATRIIANAIAPSEMTFKTIPAR